MLFNSFRFLFVFLPAVCIVYYLSARYLPVRAAKLVLVAASLVFYSFGSLTALPLLVGSILFNYVAGKAIGSAAEKRRKQILIGALATNIALLASFKYVNFALGSMAAFTHWKVALPSWEFPLGISFFTLQQVMYLVDCRDGLVQPNDLLTHAAFVSFFPSVISGPITRARQMVPQLDQALKTNADRISQGIRLFAIGLFKKVVLADAFSRIADPGFSLPGGISTLEAWASSFGYTFQIYFDFSGYTDMALAAALFLGYTLPINFNIPYRSHSVTEFWQRWHITLSNFITAYLFTPIVKSFKKVTLLNSSLATLLAMAIAGLWHGPAATFITFGTLHGVGLVVNQWWRRKIKKAVPKPMAWAATLVFVNLGFVFFRSANMADAWKMCVALLPHHNLLSLAVIRGAVPMGEMLLIVPLLIAGVIVAFLGPSSTVLSEKMKPTLTTAFATACLILIAMIY